MQMDYDFKNINNTTQYLDRKKAAIDSTADAIEAIYEKVMANAINNTLKRIDKDLSTRIKEINEKHQNDVELKHVLLDKEILTFLKELHLEESAEAYENTSRYFA